MIKIHCEHCDKVIESAADGYKNIGINIGNYSDSADLCKTCLGELMYICEQFLSGEKFKIEK